jgi:hypothetical protein
MSIIPVTALRVVACADEARANHLSETAAGDHADAGAERAAGHGTALGRGHAFATGRKDGGDNDQQQSGLEHFIFAFVASCYSLSVSFDP